MAAQGRGPVVIRVGEHVDVAATLAANGVATGAKVIVVVGGADGVPDSASEALAELVNGAVLPVVVGLRAAVVDGGTDAGVMRALGRARHRCDEDFPLIGVAAEGTVRLPGAGPSREGAAGVEPHHSHVLLVPGAGWGDEAPWISAVAGILADGRPSVTLLVNGGATAFDDAAHSLEAGRP